jgi:sporulation-regulated protein 3
MDQVLESPYPSFDFLQKQFASSAENSQVSPLDGDVVKGDLFSNLGSPGNAIKVSEHEVASLSDGSHSPPAASEAIVVDEVPLSTLVESPKRIGLSMLPNQRKELVHKTGANFTFMVCGGVGTGKSTFVNTLFGERIVSTGETTKIDLDEGSDHSDNSIIIHRAILDENGFNLRLTVIDTPLFGLKLNNRYSWSPAEKFIDEQFRVHLFQEEQPNRSKMSDSRVHCCVYFIAPTGKLVPLLDIEAMKLLSARTNLIPVIAKSDTFTTEGLLKFKATVKRILHDNKINVCDLILDQAVHDKINRVMPFAMIGSSELVEMPDGRKVRGRKYDWGVAETDNPAHCDFNELRNVMMGENMLDLILSTESHYENYRRNCLIGRFNEMVAVHGLGPTPYSPQHNFNGLEELEIFHKYKLKQLEMKIHDSDLFYKSKEKDAKVKFAKLVQSQEKRFKEWKSGLIERQEKYNKEIEMLHLKIIKLHEGIETIESGIVDSEHSLASSSLSQKSF